MPRNGPNCERKTIPMPSGVSGHSYSSPRRRAPSSYSAPRRRAPATYSSPRRRPLASIKIPSMPFSRHFVQAFKHAFWMLAAYPFRKREADTCRSFSQHPSHIKYPPIGVYYSILGTCNIRGVNTLSFKPYISNWITFSLSWRTGSAVSERVYSNKARPRSPDMTKHVGFRLLGFRV